MFFPDARAKELFFAGVKAAAPFLFGTVPFGMVVGVATVSVGLSNTAAILMTVLIFAGTAQLAVLPLLVAGAPIAIIVITTFIINLRFVIYGAALTPYFRHLSLRWKLLLGYFVTDTGFALFSRNFMHQEHEKQRHFYFLGAGMTVAAVWLGSAVAGILVGAQIPKEWQLEFAGSLAMLGLLAPFLRTRPEAIVAIVAAGVGIATQKLPMKLGLICAVVAGISAGVVAEKLLRQKARATEPTAEEEGEAQARDHNEEVVK